jgi:hypothetical protein
MNVYTFTQDRPKSSDTAVFRSVKNDESLFVIFDIVGDRGALPPALAYGYGPYMGGAMDLGPNPGEGGLIPTPSQLTSFQVGMRKRSGPG